MRPDQIVALLTAMLGGAPDPAAFPTIRAGGAQPAYPVTIEACPRPLPPFEVEGRTVICGRVEVPLDHDAPPGGPRHSLAFAVLKARSAAPAPDPLLYLHGGPGGSVMAVLAGLVAPAFDSYRARRDVVTFDQRAAGPSSEAITCYGTYADRILDIMRPGGINAEALGGEFYRACLEEIRGRGRDLSLFNTTQSARDVRAVTRALGYPAYNIYGISYGTQLGLEVMRAAPEGLRSVVLDSVSPPHERNYDLNLQPLVEATQSVLDLCAADAACARAYPDLRGMLLRVAERLEASPIPAARGRPAVTVDTLVGLLQGRNALGSWPNATAHIPLILTEWSRGETTTWDMLSSGGTRRAATPDSVVGPHERRLTPDQAALARAAVALAGEMGRTDALLRGTASRLEASIARSAGNLSDLPRQFDAALTEGVRHLPGRPERLAFLRAYAAIATAAPDRETLRALAVRLPAAEAERASAMLGLMNDAEVAAVFGAIRQETDAAVMAFTLTTDLAIMACQEHTPFNSRAGLQAYNASVPFPFLRRSDAADGAYFDLCDLVPSRPRPGYHDPVSSGIPTLILVGMADVQTSQTAGISTARTLSRSRVLSFPEAGHGVLAFSDCAMDIGVAFVETADPGVNAACIEGLRPRFVLPPTAPAPR